MKINEVCNCGAEFSVEGEFAVEIWHEWKDNHECDGPAETSDDRDTYFQAQSDKAPDHTLPEMHIGFRYIPEEEDENKRLR